MSLKTPHKRLKIDARNAGTLCAEGIMDGASNARWLETELILWSSTDYETRTAEKGYRSNFHLVLLHGSETEN